MAICFLNSSALVKRYVVEIRRLYVARITGAEMVAAVTRRLRRGATSAADTAAAIAAFRADLAVAYFPLDVGELLVSHAMDLAERQGLRGYDAVQLAAALELAARCLAAGATPPLVITADAELNRAAAAEGLAV